MNNKEKALRDVGYKKKVKKIKEEKTTETKLVNPYTSANSQFSGGYE